MKDEDLHKLLNQLDNVPNDLDVSYKKRLVDVMVNHKTKPEGVSTNWYWVAAALAFFTLVNYISAFKLDEQQMLKDDLAVDKGSYTQIDYNINKETNYYTFNEIIYDENNK